MNIVSSQVVNQIEELLEQLRSAAVAPPQVKLIGLKLV